MCVDAIESGVCGGLIQVYLRLQLLSSRLQLGGEVGNLGVGGCESIVEDGGDGSNGSIEIRLRHDGNGSRKVERSWCVPARSRQIMSYRCGGLWREHNQERPIHHLQRRRGHVMVGGGWRCDSRHGLGV